MLLASKWGTHDTWQLSVKEVMPAKDNSKCLGLGVCDGPRVAKSLKVVFEKTNSRDDSTETEDFRHTESW